MGRLDVLGLINRVLREGLRCPTELLLGQPQLRTQTADLGTCRFQDLDNPAEVLAVAEGEAFH